ncbi:AAA family ATPase [Mesorhizobium sp. BR115XR7A]|uniref:AAA family ATPase n=1 Tax=Mesorhizobium sp. BR115XR7A TaxID=2876645 RepID=UPI001CC93FBD|nr:AAA family ATPase [Mesorhizobium sp. BR115XR7A]MBZ9905283.1 AAA family ATPase [Mesorhizobium sp. BR115XR7A]MBZ9930355.1 AAA family ATPase [Mesorhizobium sp. BR1-1-5]
MSAAQLSSITLTNFRSIKGSITVPLDAPIVLIHGANGAGKTSLLSAIELALTGQVASLQGVDPDYAAHLVHKDAKSAELKIETIGLDRNETSLKVTANAIEGEALLGPDLARFYAERCFLAQSSLGRLLELYQDSAKRSDSALTKFVKDLLGLDHLDAIIDGLHDAGDVRRLRSGVPGYGETRDTIPQVEGERDRLGAELEKTDIRIRQLEEQNDALSNRLVSVGDRSVTGPTAGETEQSELLRLTTVRREVEAAALQWQQIASTDLARDRAAAQPRSENAGRALAAWSATKGATLQAVLERLMPLFSDLPSVSAGGPQPAHAAATKAVREELRRCQDVLDKDAADAKLEADHEGAVTRGRARIQALEQQISNLASEGGALAQALSGVLPHIHTDDCPVCGRNFKETSEVPLQAHVSARIAELTAAAGQLQALSRDRTSSLSAVAVAERELGEVRGRRLDAINRDALRTRVALLQEVDLSLAGMTSDVEEGQRLIGEAATASRALSDLAVQDQGGTALRQSVERFGTELGVAPLAPTEDIAAALSRFAAEASRLVEIYTANQTIRREMAGNALEVQRLNALRQPVVDATGAAQGRLDRLNAAKQRADRLILDARELAKRAGEARTAIVRKVFNGSLNRVWRDLFVRLAPEEPFVPAFAVPETNGGPVEAVLETWYRSGGKGGDPRAMLSAGNLNTSALTLFLALHLSVSPDLPWLVIDDPVQSMDEVHIAQFTALLRMLAKSNLQRQIIIAVHEKPLFDYLSLELSPAFQNDRLITIELSRSADGQTLMNYLPHVFTPDQAVAA